MISHQLTTQQDIDRLGLAIQFTDNNLVYLDFPNIKGPGPNADITTPEINALKEAFRASLPLYQLDYPTPQGYRLNYGTMNYQKSNFGFFLEPCIETTDLIRAARGTVNLPTIFKEVHLKHLRFSSEQLTFKRTMIFYEAKVVYYQMIKQLANNMPASLYLSLFCNEFEIIGFDAKNASSMASYKMITPHVEYNR